MRQIIATAYIFVLLSILPVLALAQSDCPATVQAALNKVTDVCATTGRNQACYGNIELTAVLREGVSGVSFQSPGDIANLLDLQSLDLNSQIKDQQWGIALLKLQASLPDTLPGQNVTMLLFGHVNLDNAVAPLVEIPVTTTTSARLRRTPTTEGNNVISGVPAKTLLTANGITQAGDWLRIEQPDNVVAWISAGAVQASGDLKTLAVVDSASSIQPPYGAFYFSTGAGDHPYDTAPDSGLLVQTPEGAGMVTFTANGVTIGLGSTAYFQTDGSTMRISVVEGHGLVSASGGVQIVPAGTYSTIPLDATGHAPAGQPTPPQPYDAKALAHLPLTTIFPKVVTVAPPVADIDIAQIIQQIALTDGPAPGIYMFTPTAQSQTGTPGCGWAPAHNQPITGHQDGGLAFDTPMLAQAEPGVYQGSKDYGTGQKISVVQRVTSPTEFDWEQSWQWSTTGGGKTTCDLTWHAVWQSP